MDDSSDDGESNHHDTTTATTPIPMAQSPPEKEEIDRRIPEHHHQQQPLQEIDDDEPTTMEEPEADSPHWTMLRKGAVAAVGGAMVGVGLVMVRSTSTFVGCVVVDSHYFACADSPAHALWGRRGQFGSGRLGHRIR